MSDLRVTRDRQADLADEIDRSEIRPPAPSRSAVVQTTTIDAYPTEAGRWYAVALQSVHGTEKEGDPANFAPDVGEWLAYNMGSKIPGPGTILLAHCVSGKWVFRWDG